MKRGQQCKRGMKRAAGEVSGEGMKGWRERGREGGRVIDGGEDGQGTIMCEGREGRGCNKV